MKNRKNKNIVIGTLCALIIGMAVGYAALSQILNINGTSMISGDFSIQFTKIDENTMVNATTVSKGGVGTTTANFTVDLEKPGSSAIYDLTVENKGTIDAILTSIEGLDESNAKEPVDIVYSITGIKEGDSLNSGDSKSFQVRVVWNASATSVPTTNKSLTLKLNYEQKTGSSIVTTPESCFTMNDSGAITGYTCTDTDIVIPNMVDGKMVASIGNGSLSEKGLTSVVIPDSVTSIEFDALSSNQLTSVDIPDSVTSIGGYAFDSNPLVTVTIGTGMENIDSSAFMAPSTLRRIINKSGKAFNWTDITGLGTPGTPAAVTGTYGDLEVIAG